MSLCDEKTANCFQNILPPYIKKDIKHEMNKWKTEIISKLPIFVEQKSNEEIDYWFNVLDMYTSFETFIFTIDELEFIGNLLFNFVINYQHPTLVMTAASLFVSIIEPRKFKLNLNLPWRPLYQLIYDSTLSRSKTNLIKYPSRFSENLITLVRICRNYWDINATKEMLNEWGHLLDPHNQTFALGQCLLTLFLPVQYGQHNLWLSKFIEIWSYFRSVTYDFPFFEIIARLSRYNYQDIDWEFLLPFIFNVGSLHMGIPTSLLDAQIPHIVDYHPEHYSSFFKDFNSLDDLLGLFASIIIQLINGPTGSLTRSLLEKILFLITPFCTTSHQAETESQFEAPLAFLDELVKSYSKRLKSEKLYDTKLEKLTESDNEWFVSCLSPLIVMTQFHEVSSFSNLTKFVQLCPKIAIPPILDAISYTFGYEHLKQTGLQALISITSTIAYSKQSQGEFMALVLKTNEEISFMDISKSSAVFSLYTLVSSCFTFSNEHEPFILSVINNCIEFAKHSVGEDYISSLGELLTMLSHLIHAIPERLADRISLLIKSKMNEIPEYALMALVEGLDNFSTKYFKEIAINATNLQQFTVLKALVRQAEQFFLNDIEKLKETLMNGIKNSNKKLQEIAVPTLKWTLKNMLCTYPQPPKKQGFSSIKNIDLNWHCPSEQEIVNSISLSRHFLPFIEESLLSKSRFDQLLGISVSRAILKGILAGVSTVDLECVHENLHFSHPSLNRFHDKRVSLLFEEILMILLKALKSPNINRRSLTQLFKLFELVVAPRDLIASQVESLTNEWSYHSSHGRVPLLIDPNEAMTNTTIYWKAVHLYSMRHSLDHIYLTTLNRKIIEAAFELCTHQFIKVRENASGFIQVATSNFRYHFYDLFENIILKIEKGDLSDEYLSGYCDALSSLPTCAPSIMTFDLIFRTALAICFQLSPDEILEPVRSLRQIIVILIDQTDISNYIFNDSDIFYKKRYYLAHEAIKKHDMYPASRETQHYAAALVCSVLIGNPIIATVEIYNFISNLLKTDDNVVRDCVLNLAPSMIEYLIPRVPRIQGNFYEEISFENYDNFSFIDRQMYQQAKKMPLFLNYENYLNKNKLKQFYKDEEIENIISINQSLFNLLFNNNEIFDTLINQLIIAQINKQDNFSKGRVVFWYCMSRYFGITFSIRLIKLVDSLINKTSTVAHHVVSTEIFAGVLRSLKCRKYFEVYEISKITLPFVTRLIQELEPEFYSLWHFSFYSCFNEMDPKRLFWLYNHLLTCIPLDNSVRAARVVSLLSEILLDVSIRIPSFSKKIEEIASKTIFTPDLLSYEQIRDSAVRVLITLLSISFDSNKRSLNEFSIQLLEKFTQNISSDQFLRRWILNCYGSQSLATLSSGFYSLKNINEWTKLILDNDEGEERISRAGLLNISTQNWIGSCVEYPLNINNIQKLINLIINEYIIPNNKWQIQTVLLLTLESFLSTIYFYLNDEIFEKILKIIYNLLSHQHPDVQDAASELLSFIIKGSISIQIQIPDIIIKLKNMLNDYNSIYLRIGGAKGLCSIISATVLFEIVPQYIIDSFEALTNALEIDKVVEPTISQFLSDFWSTHDDNLLKPVLEILSPFKASLQPSYFC